MPSVCDPILPSDIQIRSQLCFACGMVGEILPETIRKLRTMTSLLIGDLQGLLRVVQEDRSVSLARLEETPYASGIEQFDFLKGSEEELERVDLEFLTEHMVVIATRGAEASTVYLRSGQERSVDGYPGLTVDPTGAGDCFLSGFGYAILNHCTLEEALKFGNYCGSQCVQQIGVPKLDGEELRAAYEELK